MCNRREKQTSKWLEVRLRGSETSKLDEHFTVRKKRTIEGPELVRTFATYGLCTESTSVSVIHRLTNSECEGKSHTKEDELR